MRLGPHHFDGGFCSFLLFLRLMLVSLCCLLGTPVFAYFYGPSVGLAGCLAAYPLWWYHFGLPRFKEREDGFFSARFCLYGYIFMSAVLIVVVLEYFEILKEGRPILFMQQFGPYFRVAFWLGFAAYCAYEFIKWKATKKDD
jgi:hypothetical protein